MKHLAVRFLLLVACSILAIGPAARAEEDPGKGEPGKAGEKPEKPEKAEKAEKAEKGKKKKAKAAAKSDSHDLEAWGALKEVKGTPFYTLAYTKMNGRKASKVNVFVKPAEDAVYYQDKMVPYTELKEGDTVWVLGRPVEHDLPATEGLSTGGVDRQLQNVVAMAMGEGLRVNEKFKDPRDPKLKWCQVKVTKAGPALHVNFEEGEYKVTLAKQTPVLVREKIEAKPLKSGAQVEVSADKSAERPETKSAADEKKESFTAKRIVFLDPRLARAVYPTMLE